MVDPDTHRDVAAFDNFQDGNERFLDGGALLIVFGIGEINASRVLVKDAEFVICPLTPT